MLKMIEKLVVVMCEVDCRLYIAWFGYEGEGLFVR